MPETGVRAQREQRHRRANVQLPIRISTIDAEIDSESGKRYFRSSEEICRNLSRGGAFVSTRDPVAPGRRLLIEIELPGGTVVETIGRVAWMRTPLGQDDAADGSGIGVEFLGSSPEHLSRLERYVSQVTTRRYQAPARETQTALSTPGSGA